MNRDNAKYLKIANEASRRLFQDAILYLLQRAEKFDDESSRELARHMLLDASPHDVTSAHFLRYLQRSGMTTGSARSFRVRLVEMYDRHQVGFRSPSWFLDDKLVGYRMADLVGLKRPQVTDGPRRWSDLEIRPGRAIKILNSSASRGCYLVYDWDNIWSVQEGKRIRSLPDLEVHVREYFSSAGIEEADAWWISEELVTLDPGSSSSALDIKAFCFYGEVELVRAIGRFPSVRTASWDGDRAVVYPLSKPEATLDGVEFPSEAVEIAAELSLKVPAPFVRIDLIQGNDGVYFGEFTPWPGTLARHSSEWDARLGEAWIRAESRLQDDFLVGKSFNDFLQATNFSLGEKAEFPT